MRRRIALFLFFASLAGFACKDDPDRPPASGNTGAGPPSSSGGGGSTTPEGGAGGDGGTDSGTACNAIVNDGDVVDQNGVVGDPQTGTGGNIANGTYELTGAELFVGASGVPGPTGVTYKGVLQITDGKKLERVTEVTANQGATPVDLRTTADFIVIGTTITVTQSCPATLQEDFTYSVQGNTLNLTSLSAASKASFTFTLR